MRNLIHEFVEFAIKTNLQFYNESTLQMELALFIRRNRPRFKVYLERPITDFGKRKSGGKKEIDICVLNAEQKLHAAIEVKMPCCGRVPESMFDYCRDIQFCETLVCTGFRSAYAFILTPDRKFCSGKRKSKIYRFFRGRDPIHGLIQKPTGARDKKVKILGSYPILWHERSDFIFSLIEVTH